MYFRNRRKNIRHIIFITLAFLAVWNNMAFAENFTALLKNNSGKRLTLIQKHFFDPENSSLSPMTIVGCNDNVNMRAIYLDPKEICSFSLNINWKNILYDIFDGEYLLMTVSFQHDETKKKTTPHVHYIKDESIVMNTNNDIYFGGQHISNFSLHFR